VRVFIADNSMPILERLKVMISDISEIEIIGEAKDGIGAIKAVRELNPDVVILDIKMPGVDGIDVLNYIKNNTQNITVIMLTNYPYPQYRKKCMELGADYFFKKSTEFENVMETLKQLIQNSKDNEPIEPFTKKQNRIKIG
jgi:DNA-binding NarL/FixJ family response regulator